MNKVEAKGYQEAEKFYNKRGGFMGDVIEGFVGGWDAHEELDLPVKFAEWISYERNEGWFFVQEWSIWYTRDNKYSYTKKNGKTTQELYKYWIDNIYKPE